MKQLLSIEWLKIRKLKATYIILAAFIVLLPVWMIAMNFWFGKVNENISFPLFPSTKELWTFPTVWKFVTWSASWFNYVLGILIIILVTQEFSNRTLRQHVIDGLSRRQVIFSKFLVVILLSGFATLYVFLTGLVFGISQSEEIDLYTNIHHVFLFFIQTVCYFGFVLVVALLIKRAAISILLFYGYLFVEMIVGLFIPANLYAFLPANIMAMLTPMPFLEILTKPRVENGELILLATWQIAAVGIVYLLFFYWFAYFRLRRRDL